MQLTTAITTAPLLLLLLIANGCQTTPTLSGPLAFAYLDVYLTSSTQSEKLIDNLSLLKGEFVSNLHKVAHGPTNNWIAMLSQLNSDDICNINSLKTFRMIIGGVLADNRNAFNSDVIRTSRLSRLLAELFRDTQSCYSKLKAEWTESGAGGHFEALYGAAFGAFDKYFSKHAKGNYTDKLASETDLRELDGALESTGFDKSIEPLELLAMIVEIHRKVTNKAQLVVQDNAPISQREAQEYLDKYLIELCEQLAQDFNENYYDNILVPAVELGQLYTSDQSLRLESSSLLESSSKQLHIFRWAARYLMCEHLLDQHWDSLVDALVKAHAESIGLKLMGDKK